MTERRMDAYYYGFDTTGVEVVDKILGAVACAGKAYHHTDDWNDETRPYDDHTGDTPVEWIQNAAKEAADRIEKLEKALRIAAGYISTFPPHTDQHPEDVYNWILMQLETE